MTNASCSDLVCFPEDTRKAGEKKGKHTQQASLEKMWLLEQQTRAGWNHVPHMANARCQGRLLRWELLKVSCKGREIKVERFGKSYSKSCQLLLDPPLFLTLPLSPLCFVDWFLDHGWWLFLVAVSDCGFVKSTHTRAVQYLQGGFRCFSFLFFLVWSGALLASR